MAGPRVIYTSKHGYKSWSGMQGGPVSGFYLVSSLSEIWVKIQSDPWLTGEALGATAGTVH